MVVERIEDDELRTVFKVDVSAEHLGLFWRELGQEFAAVRSGVAPDPATVPHGYGTLPFARQMNARAYDAISADYGDRLFEDEMYRVAFEDWVARLPAGGHVLDVGCGHGAPVVAELLKRGFRVTGLDVSEAMLARARTACPSAAFLNCPPTELTKQDTYDGVCSFFALLHTDPIELRVALDRIRRALKPGGYLLIGSLLSDVSAHQGPLYCFKQQRVWGCEFSAAELQAALTARDGFTVLHQVTDVKDVDTASDGPSPEASANKPTVFGGKQRAEWFTVLAQRKT